MSEIRHLYLNTLEIEPLEVGGLYNPLPPHLTLMSRYWSELKPDEISLQLSPLFKQMPLLELTISDDDVIGPKHTPVHIIAPSTELINLHHQLKQELNILCVTYAYPHFVGQSWKPHVSYREGSDYKVGTIVRSSAAYLIEVTRTAKGDVRFVSSKFNLQTKI